MVVCAITIEYHDEAFCCLQFFVVVAGIVTNVAFVCAILNAADDAFDCTDDAIVLDVIVIIVAVVSIVVHNVTYPVLNDDVVMFWLSLIVLLSLMFFMQILQHFLPLTSHKNE